MAATPGLLPRAAPWLLGVVVVASLLPFVERPLNIDDPVYVWVAKRITESPADFYGFGINWYGKTLPAHVINKNPPLVSFYLAGVGLLFGWSERALHLAMFVPALALVLSIYGLGRQLCRSPVLAALLAWATPLVLVSSTTLMCDILMLSLWCGALYAWLRGIRDDRWGPLLLAGLAAGLAVLAKYFALALLPLLGVHGAFVRRRPGRWLLALGLPLAMVAAYLLYLRARYGFEPLRDLGGYALDFEATEIYSSWERGLVGLCFIGGGALTTALFAPGLWSRRALAGGAGAVLAGAGLLACLPHLGPLSLERPWGERLGLTLQLAGMAGAGLQLLLLAALELWRRRDGDAWLLALWLGGTLLFTAFMNWTPTARAALPAAPAAALLVVRRIEARSGRSPQGRPAAWAAVALGLALSLWVAVSDARLADTGRQAAQDLTARFQPPYRRIHFQAAWGFMYYMEVLGAVRLDFAGTTLRPGDVMIVPANNTNALPLPPGTTRLIETAEYPVGSGLATLSTQRGAGFYAALFGPLPFALGSPRPEAYHVLQVTRRLTTDEIERFIEARYAEEDEE